MTEKSSNVKITEFDENTIDIFIPVNIRKRSGYTTIILPETNENCNQITPENYNEKLIDAFSKAYKWQNMLKEGKASSLSEIAKKEKTNDSYARKLFKLNYVAPDIVEAIMDGKQPAKLSLRDFTHRTIPDLWEEQRKTFGF